MTDGWPRRRLLRTAVNVGTGAGLVWGGGADLASSGDVVEIVYAMVREPDADRQLVPRTRTVPADWYGSIQAAFDVQETLRRAGLSSLLGSFVLPGSYESPTAAVAVELAGGGGDALPVDPTDGVEVEESDLGKLIPKPDRPSGVDAMFEVDDLDGREVPGGGSCSSPLMAGTLAPAAYDARRGGRFFLTSNHLYGAAGAKETAHADEPLELHGDDRDPTLGTVERGYPSADFVEVAPTDGYEPESRLARAVPSEVVGHFTRIGLADRMARGAPLQKYGAASGHTSGRIHGVDGLTCYLGEVCKAGQLKWGDKLTMTDGDSGSINYAPDPEHPDEAVIVGGLNNAWSWWPGADFTWGTAAFHLYRAFGVHF